MCRRKDQRKGGKSRGGKNPQNIAMIGRLNGNNREMAGVRPEFALCAGFDSYLHHE
jgi:hypothetical protein